MLFRSADYSQKQHEQIKALEKAIDRLIRLNRFLLMIARINNNQFPASKPIAINKYVDDFLDSCNDFIEIKQLNVRKRYHDHFSLTIHPQLAEILVSNLLSNAIRYNIKQGILDVDIDKSSIRIVNTYGNVIPPGNLFARFNKSVNEKDSVGLGLSIIDSICKKNNLHCKVEISESLFTIEISQY